MGWGGVPKVLLPSATGALAQLPQSAYTWRLAHRLHHYNSADGQACPAHSQTPTVAVLARWTAVVFTSRSTLERARSRPWNELRLITTLPTCAPPSPPSSANGPAPSPSLTLTSTHNKVSCSCFLSQTRSRAPAREAIGLAASQTSGPFSSF